MEAIEGAINLDARSRLTGPLRHDCGRLSGKGIDLPQPLFKVSCGHCRLDPEHRCLTARAGMLAVDPPDSDEAFDMGQGFVDPSTGLRHPCGIAGGREYVTERRLECVMRGNARAGMRGQNVEVCLDFGIIPFDGGDGFVFRSERSAAVDGIPQLAKGNDERRMVITGSGGETVQHPAKVRHIPTKRVNQAGSLPVRDIGSFDGRVRNDRRRCIAQGFIDSVDALDKFCKVRLQSGAITAFSGKRSLRRIKAFRELRHGKVDVRLAILRSEVKHPFLEIGKACRSIAHSGPQPGQTGDKGRHRQNEDP